MSTNSFSVYFFLRKGSIERKKLKIYCRILINRVKTDFATSCSIDPKKWDINTGRAIGDNSINDELAAIEAQIRLIRRRLIDNEQNFDAKTIAELYKGNKKSNVFILEFFQQKIDRIYNEAGRKHTANRKNYITAKGHIQAFLLKIYNKKDLLVQLIDLETIHDLDDYCII